MPRFQPHVPRQSGNISVFGVFGDAYASDSPDEVERRAASVQASTRGLRQKLLDRTNALETDASLSASGRIDAVKALGESLLQELATNDAKLEELQGDANQSENRLHRAEEDDAQSGDRVLNEIRQREVRDALAAMSEMRRAQTLTKAIATTDAETVRAALGAPAVLDLLTDQQREELENDWLRARWPELFTRAEALALMVETLRADVESTELAIRERCGVPKPDDFYKRPPQEAATATA